MKPTDKQINEAEEAVIKLSFAFDKPEREIVRILSDGFNLNAYDFKPKENEKIIIDELENTFI